MSATSDSNELKLGLNIIKGDVVYEAVAEVYDLPYVNVDKYLN